MGCEPTGEWRVPTFWPSPALMHCSSVLAVAAIDVNVTLIENEYSPITY